ncbi:MAG: hypothetical protein ACHQT6_10630 [Candidatus Acidiferrales bacterium]
MTNTLAFAQSAPKPTAQKTTTHRANELTLAGLRPGRDSRNRATQLYGAPEPAKDSQGSQISWTQCGIETLIIDVDVKDKIQVIRVVTVHNIQNRNVILECESIDWKTGYGLRLGDPASKAAQLYGEPDSRSPSTKDGQPLELWYYAFDRAGPDVPQVMEVLCTKEKEGQPGSVVEITLAAPSL